MCFSATASFAAAAATGLAGALSLALARRPGDAPLAAVPLVFAVQQAIEGLLWLRLPTGAPTGHLTLAYLILAEVVWPICAPLVILLAEPSVRRRKFILPWLIVGGVVAAYLLRGLLSQPPIASATGCHIVYTTRSVPGLLVVGGAYLAATCLPPLLSSQRTVVGLGLVVLAGSAVSFFFYYQAFTSVWCFVAAAASGLILAHFAGAEVPRPAHAV